jgi:hypothetical protein
MKRLCFAALALSLAASLHASEGVDDVVKLSKAGLSQDVMLAFVNSSNNNYNPSADEIKSMRDSGVSATVIVAMLDHGKDSSASASSSSSSNSSSSPQYSGNGSAQDVNAPPPSYNGNGQSAPPSEYGDSAPATVYAPPEKDANISYFYQALSPAGTWHETSFGWAWHPGVVSVEANWRPYCNGGHWTWTDHGWYWESSYPWGWATFHYGRWANDPSVGWVWIPDTTWGPAWVNWRHSDEYYGWAPLPPAAHFDAGVGFSFNSDKVGFNIGVDFGLHERDYSFVACDHFLEPNLAIAIVPEARVTTVFRSTTIIKNTYVYNNSRVINNGIAVSDVTRVTRRQVETVRIADANFSAGVAIRGEVHAGGTIAVYRPRIEAVAPLEPSKAIATSVYVKRTVRSYPSVSASSERLAQSRLSTEITRRSTSTTVRTTERTTETDVRSHVREDASAERRVDSEVSSRERERTNSEATVRERERETASRETAPSTKHGEVERRQDPPRRDDPHAKQNEPRGKSEESHGKNEDSHGKKKGHDDN